MASHATGGVIDRDHRVFGMANLFITDGSTLPTQGAANPGLTIMALAAAPPTASTPSVQAAPNAAAS